MKFRSCFLLFVLLFVSSVPACTPRPASTQPNVNPPPASATRTLAKVEPTVYKAPNPDLTAQVFLNAWKAEDYPTMYGLLTPASQDALALDRFTQHYKDAAVNMTLQKLEYEILGRMTNPSSAQVAYRVTFHTQMIGDLHRDITMNLSMEKGAWRVQWDDGLILPELHGGNVLVMNLKSPTRGNIYDRNGNAVAVANDIFALGIQKGDMEHEGLLLSELSKLTGKDPEAIKALYDRDSVYQGDYVPVGEATRDAVLARYDVLSGLYSDGLRMTEYSGRFYPNGGIAPHVTGYVQAIPAEEQDKYLREGFRLDDRVGMAGLELWGEQYLLGQREASLHVTDPQGIAITRLMHVDSKPSQSIYMTIDNKLQLEAQKAIAGFSGAIVVVERDSGRVLALVSSPGFDPNAFEYQNFNSGSLLGMFTGDGLKRLYNRAAGNGYPLGSVFKIITMAAALESGLIKADDTLNCGWDWTEIPGLTLTDWTKEKGYEPSGELTLPEGLMRSCNPWFYHIGYMLYQQGHEQDISNMARAFGLGAKTGIEGLDFDEPGNIPDPVDDQSAALIAIGQDKVLVNPLQVARFVAAVGNGGTLYRPQLVEKITDPDDKASFTFKPDVQGKLPVKPENLQIIQEAMRWVVSSKRGTAVRAFSGLNIPVNGKTGTAQNDLQGQPHAWFAGYTDTGNPAKPDIAFAVIAEYAGEGSEIAAPIARRILEVYYLGQPQRVYPWESRINVTRTPTPSGTEAPVPENPQNPQSGEVNPPAPEDNSFNMRTATPAP
jgi:penicillin-binding protein 2